MRSGVKIILLSIAIIALSFAATNALAATESGYLYGPGATYTFTVYDPTDVTFSYPKGFVDFWVSVVGPDGRTVIGNFDLDKGEIIQLSGGGPFYLTIYSNRGAGNWSASYGGGYAPGNCNVGGNSAWGYLSGSGDTCSFTLDAYVSQLVIYFTHPGNSVDFWVEIVGRDARTILNNVDLSSSSGAIELIGGGKFYITVYSNRGAGNWSCTW